MLGLVRACTDSATQQGQQNIIAKSKGASQSLGKLVTALKANAVLSKEIDSAIVEIVSAEKNLDLPPMASGQGYQAIKEGLTSLALDIADKSASLNSTDKVTILR